MAIPLNLVPAIHIHDVFAMRGAVVPTVAAHHSKPPHPRLSELAYDAILASILRHELTPGKRIRTDELAEKLGMSPTPVRTALGLLSTQGILTTIPRRGMYVASVSLEDLDDLNEARLTCECFAAEKAVVVATDQQIEGLKQHLREYRALVDMDAHRDRLAFLQKDSQFHQALVDLAGNRRISEFFGTLSIHVCYLLLGVKLGPSPTETLQIHSDICEAVASSDAAGAVSLLRRHILGE